MAGSMRLRARGFAAAVVGCLAVPLTKPAGWAASTAGLGEGAMVTAKGLRNSGKAGGSGGT